MARTILKAKPDNANSPQANSNYGNALFNHQSPRMDDDERSFERPPPKGSAELFNPKGGAGANKRPGGTQEKPEKDKEKKRADSLPPNVPSEPPAPGSVSARLAELNGDSPSAHPSS